MEKKPHVALTPRSAAAHVAFEQTLRIASEQHSTLANPLNFPENKTVREQHAQINAEAENEMQQLNMDIDQLGPEKADVLKLTEGAGMTLVKAAGKLGVKSPSSIQYRRNAALVRLRASLKPDDFRILLGMADGDDEQLIMGIKTSDPTARYEAIGDGFHDRADRAASHDTGSADAAIIASLCEDGHGIRVHKGP